MGDCPLCFGKILPLSVCESCGTTKALEGVDEIGPTLECEDCGASNDTHFACTACTARFPYGEVVERQGPVCPICNAYVPPHSGECPTCGALLVPEGLASLERLFTIECPKCRNRLRKDAAVCTTCGHRLAPEPETPPSVPGPPPTIEELLDELQGAVIGEDKLPPPPLVPEVPAEVVAGKKSMAAFLAKTPGVSKRAADAVSGFFQNIEQVVHADVVQIAAIPGVGPAEARLIRVAVVRLLAAEAKIGPPEGQEPPGAAPQLAAEVGPSTLGPRDGALPARRASGLEGRRGLINGRGLVNGRGRVNGLINGTGFVNGVSIAETPLSRPNLMPRYFAIGTGLLALFSIAVGLVEPELPGGFVIDGRFDDWERAGAPLFVDGTPSANPNVQIDGTSVQVEDRAVFLRVRVAGNIFGHPSDWETMYAFLDVDGNNLSGYDLTDVGADYVVRVSGSNASVGDATLLRFDGYGRARDDWAAFVSTGRVTAMSAGSQVEAAVPEDSLEGFLRSAMRVRFAFDDNAGETSHTLIPVGAQSGALLVEQSADMTTIAPAVQPFLRLTFRSLGNEPFTIQHLRLETTSAAIFSIPPAFTVAAGTSEERTINVDATGLQPGTLVTARVSNVTFQPALPFSIVGDEARAYVSRPPAAKVIDGLFDDWPSPVPDSDLAPVRRRSLDIMTRDASVSGEQMFLYAEFGGVALEGGLTPHRQLRPSSSGPGAGPSPAPSGPPAPLIGQDYIRFYVDTDASTPGGFEVGGISADRLFEIRGRSGRVLDASVHRFLGPGWVREAAVDWGLGGDEIEIGVSLPGTPFINTQFTVIAADWAGVADRTDAGATRTRGEPGLTPLDGTNFQTAYAKALASAPTVDGNCGTGGSEYEGSEVYSNANVRFVLGRRSDTQFVYVCLEVTADGTDNAADWGELLFDQEHNDSTTPQDNDRRFRTTRSQTFTQEKGDGFTWVSCGGSCDGGNTATSAFNNSKETYEFKIRFSDIWGDNSPSTNERAGFAVMAHNEGVGDYHWGADNANQDNPSTWGRLEIPEYPSLLTASALGVLIPLLRRKRR